MKLIVVVAIVCSLFLVPMAAMAEPVVIEHLLKSTSPTDNAFRQAAELFHSVQDEVRVTFSVGSNSPSAYNNTVIVRTAAGTPPDILSSNWLGEVGGNGLALSLNSFLEDDSLKKEFVPDVLRLCSWEDQVIQLPLWVQPLVTYYNKQLFAQAGLQDPTDLAKSGDWTWDSIMEAAPRLTTDTNSDGTADTWGFGLGGYTITRSVLWVLQAGGYFFDSPINPKESRMTSPEVKNALQYLWAMIYEKGLPLEAIATGAAYNNFPKQSVGMIFDGPWSIGINRHWTDWDLAPPPQGPASADTAVQIDGVQISKLTKHPEAAWKWLQFLVTDPRAVEILTRETGRPPAALSQLRLYEQVGAVDGHPNVRVIVNTLMQDSFSPLMPLSPYWGQLERTYSAAMAKFYRNQESLGNTVEQLNDQFNLILSGK